MWIPSQGQTTFSFIDFITYQDKQHCLIYEYAEYISKDTSDSKALFKVRCLPGRGNGTLQIIQSLKEAVSLLAPHGNNTKKTDEGNCALVLFYTKTCPISALAAPQFNAVSKLYPDMQIGAIDAVRFHGLNTDFGIVGLPTIMLFHQGM